MCCHRDAYFFTCHLIIGYNFDKFVHVDEFYWSKILSNRDQSDKEIPSTHINSTEVQFIFSFVTSGVYSTANTADTKVRPGQPPFLPYLCFVNMAPARRSDAEQMSQTFCASEKFAPTFKVLNWQPQRQTYSQIATYVQSLEHVEVHEEHLRRLGEEKLSVCTDFPDQPFPPPLEPTSDFQDMPNPEHFPVPDRPVFRDLDAYSFIGNEELDMNIIDYNAGVHQVPCNQCRGRLTSNVSNKCDQCMLVPCKKCGYNTCNESELCTNCEVFSRPDDNSGVMVSRSLPEFPSAAAMTQESKSIILNELTLVEMLNLPSTFAGFDNDGEEPNNQELNGEQPCKRRNTDCSIMTGQLKSLNLSNRTSPWLPGTSPSLSKTTHLTRRTPLISRHHPSTPNKPRRKPSFNVALERLRAENKAVVEVFKLPIKLCNKSDRK